MAEGASSETGGMGGDQRLLLAIVQDADARAATDALTRARFSVTSIATAGGFLRRGNVTLLVGVAAEQVPAVLSILEAECQARSELVVPSVMADYTGMVPVAPIEVQLGGATVFILPVAHMERV